MIYITVQGDTFDSISKKCYGDEKLLQRLLDANPKAAGTVVFGEGVPLQIPELSETEKRQESPAPWRK